MIKMVYCLRRKPGLTREEFQRYWREQHALLVKRVAPDLNVRRYVQSHTLAGDALAMVAEVRGSAGREFDGVAELWWDSVDSIVAAVSTEAGQQAGAALVEDETRFIDLPNSPIFFAEEIAVVG
jgi:uncharacterized protein (TIGR02118 family)